MKYLLLALCLSVSLLISAQNVGIGNTSPASRLDVSGDLSLREGTAISVVAGINRLTLPASKNSVYRLAGAIAPFTISAVSGGNDGMLLTLINSTGQAMTIRDTTGIRTNINADLISTGTVSVVTMLYNSSINKWVVTASEGFNNGAWSTTGNSGTTSSNYIGTSDNNPLYIKTNGAQAGYIPASPTDNIMIGKGSLPTGTTNVIVGSGNHSLMSTSNNIAVGGSALGGTVSGSSNIAIGGSAMSNGTSGQSNIGIGLNSQIDLTSGSFNTAIGQGTLFNNTTGGNNIAIGQDALRNNISGSDNVALGNGAGDSVLGSNNVFLGYNAGYKEKGSNKLYIDNSNTTTPLVYGDFTNNHITINDSLTAKYLQVTNGAANGYILQSDANGNTKWINPSSLVGSGWNTTGNSGTNSFNFIGTTDNNPLYFKTNNNMAGYLPASGTDNILLGLSGLSTGIDNISIGNSSGGGGANSGSNNVAIGTSAQANTTTGYNNIGIGDAAAFSVGTGSDNIAIGSGSLQSNAGSSYNIAVGSVSLTNNVSGSNNIGMGAFSGFNNNGYNNIFLGTYAGSAETGSYKLIIDNVGYVGPSGNPSPLIYGDFSSRHLTINDGLTAKYLQMTNGSANGYILQSDATGNGSWVSPNTFLPATTDSITLSGTALTSTVNGVSSPAVDIGGLFWGTTGNSGMNTSTNFIGTTNNADVVFKRNNVQAGLLNDSKSNTSWGTGALSPANTGSANTAMGYYALGNNTNAGNNTAIGENALAGNTTGAFNTAIGSSVMGANNSGHDNAAVGYASLARNNSGTINTAIGNYALTANTTASANTALGYSAMLANTTGTENTSLGTYTLYNSVTGDSNTAVGTYALNLSRGAGSNTAIGHSALRSDTSGRGNTAVGYSALGSDTSGNYNSALGYHADVASKALNNTTAIGANAYATLSNTVVIGGITGINGGSSVNVGIGTNAPTNRLEVAGNTKTTNLQMTTGATNGYVLKSDAAGNASWVNPSTLSTIATNTLSLSGTAITSTVNGVASTALDISSVDKNIYNTNGTLTSARMVTMGGNSLGFNGGTVAIGAASATQTLEVTGNTLVGISDNTAMGIDAQTGARLGFVKKFGTYPHITSASGAPIIFSQTNQVDIFTNISTATLTERMRIDVGGNVGIGNSSPAYNLDVTGNLHASTNIYATGYLRADSMNILYANGNTPASNNVVLRKDANNAYLWPWGTGTAANTVIVGGGASANFQVSGTTNLSGGWASQSITPNGYARMGTLLMQWGTISYTSNNAVTITFPTAFTNLYSITTTVDAGGNTGSGANAPVKVMNSGTTTFQIAGQASFSGDAVTKIRWMAIGN